MNSKMNTLETKLFEREAELEHWKSVDGTKFKKWRLLRKTLSKIDATLSALRLKLELSLICCDPCLFDLTYFLHR